jgi:hypothetical protein
LAGGAAGTVRDSSLHGDEPQRLFGEVVGSPFTGWRRRASRTWQPSKRRHPRCLNKEPGTFGNVDIRSDTAIKTASDSTAPTTKFTCGPSVVSKKPSCRPVKCNVLFGLKPLPGRESQRQGRGNRPR